MSETKQAETQSSLEILDVWLGENYPTLKASLRKTDIGYLIAAAMLKFGKFQTQQTAKEIADEMDRKSKAALILSLPDQGWVDALQHESTLIREKYEVK